MTSCKKIGVDFHGVISAYPEFFAKLIRILRQRGFEIYIISGGPCDYIADFLAEHNIGYDNLWCIFDYFNAKEKIPLAADGSFHIDDALWNTAKGEFCAREHICLHIDNSTVYGRYFTTPYVRFDTQLQTFEFTTAVPISSGAEKIADIMMAACACSEK